jgi:cation:H+ antiporter
MELFDVSGWNLWAIVAAFVAAAGVIAWAGTVLTRAADVVADLTGLGEALVGAVLLGAMTSLAGVVTTLVAAANAHPTLAVGNAIGGIAVQTLFLAVADLFYRRANLEHAAASLPNLMSSALLIALLVLLLMVVVAPEATVWGIHPGSPLVLAAYLGGVGLAHRATEKPRWRPVRTTATVEDEPDDEAGDQRLAVVMTRLLASGAVVAAAGWVLARTAPEIADRTPMSESFVGSLFTAVATSLPELVVSVQAVRRGALTLAVGNIVGGNSFEVLVVAAADLVYRDGSILHAASTSQAFIIGLTALLMCVLLIGLLHRQRKGPAGIGWESTLIIVLFVAGYAVLYTLG